MHVEFGALLLFGVLGVFDVGGLGRSTESRRSEGRGAGTILAISIRVPRRDLVMSDFGNKPKLYRSHGRIRAGKMTRSLSRHGSFDVGGTDLCQVVQMQFPVTGEDEN